MWDYILYGEEIRKKYEPLRSLLQGVYIRWMDENVRYDLTYLKLGGKLEIL